MERPGSPAPRPCRRLPAPGELLPPLPVCGRGSSHPLGPIRAGATPRRSPVRAGPGHRSPRGSRSPQPAHLAALSRGSDPASRGPSHCCRRAPCFSLLQWTKAAGPARAPRPIAAPARWLVLSVPACRRRELRRPGRRGAGPPPGRPGSPVSVSRDACPPSKLELTFPSGSGFFLCVAPRGCISQGPRPVPQRGRSGSSVVQFLHVF